MPTRKERSAGRRERKKLKKRNATTFDAESDKAHFHAVIGGADDNKFRNKVELERWGGETRLGLELEGSEDSAVEEREDEILARKGKIETRIKPRRERREAKADWHVIDLGRITPSQVSAEFELWHEIPQDKPIVTFYRTEPHIGLFGESSRLGDRFKKRSIDIPVTRSASNNSNELYFDQGGTIINFHVLNEHGGLDILATWTKAQQEIFLEDFGIELYQLESGGDRLYYKHERQDFKFASPEVNYYSLWSYQNFALDRQIVENYLKPDADINEDRPGVITLSVGIKKHFPQVKRRVTMECIKRFMALLGVSYVKRDLTADEIAEWQRKEVIVSSPKWINKGERNDVRRVGKNFDGLQYDMVFRERPKKRDIVFKLDGAQGLTFLPQRAPNAEERAFGVQQPPNIKDSIAVYRDDKSGPGYPGQAAAEKYRGGKVGHLDRVWCEDRVTGEKVWAKMRVNKAKTKLIVTPPQDFYDGANWRDVFVDPTFGYGSQGGNGQSMIGAILGTKWAPTFIPRRWIPESMTSFVNLSAGARFKTAIYDETVETAATYVHGTEDYVSPAGEFGWRTLNFTPPNPAPLGHPPKYGLMMNGTSAYLCVAYFDYGQAYDGHLNNQAYVIGDSPIGWSSPQNHRTLSWVLRFSVYFTYRVEALGKLVNKRRSIYSRNEGKLIA